MLLITCYFSAAYATMSLLDTPRLSDADYAAFHAAAMAYVCFYIDTHCHDAR